MSYKKILFRRDIAANWTSENPVLAEGEVGFETDNPSKIKIGNGSTAWNSLNYFVGDLAGVTLTSMGDTNISSPASGDFLKYDGTDWINDPINLGTDTVGNYMSNITAGTGVTVTHTPGEGSSASIAIGQSVATNANPSFAGATLDAVQVGITAAGEIDTTTGNLIIDSAGGTVTVDDNLVVSGNLTVSGTTTTVNTATLNVADNIVTLNSDYTTGMPTENAGIEVLRGSSSTVAVRWNETDDVWEFTNDGTTYFPVVGTTISQTLTNKTIALTSNTFSGTKAQFNTAVTDDDIAFVGTANAFTANQTVTGTVTTQAASTQDAVVLQGRAGGTNSRSVTITPASLTASRTLTLPDTTGTVVTTGDSGTVTSTMIADGTIVNADINTSAAITLSKLASGTSAQVIVADASGVPTYRTLSGDVTVSNTGVVTIAASPAFTGTPTAPTAAASTNSTQIATTAYVVAASQDDQFVLASQIFG